MTIFLVGWLAGVVFVALPVWALMAWRGLNPSPAVQHRLLGREIARELLCLGDGSAGVSPEELHQMQRKQQEVPDAERRGWPELYELCVALKPLGDANIMYIVREALRDGRTQQEGPGGSKVTT